MERADKAEGRRAERPRDAEREGERDVTPPSPIRLANEAGVTGEFELPDPQELRKIESDTQSRLKAILEVAGVTGLSQIDAQTFQDPEILRKLTNSVSSALDEAATALTRMKSERGSYEAFLRGAHQPSPPSPPLTTTPSPSSAPRVSGDGRGASAPQAVGGVSGDEVGRGGRAPPTGGWVPPHDIGQGPSGGLGDGSVANEVGGVRGGASSQGESIQTMHRLLTQGQTIQDASEDGESLLSLACSAGYYELAEVLLRMRASVEDRGVKGDSTPLMEAASGGYADIVKLLISHGANVNAKSSAGNTALTYACCGGYEEVVRLLLEAGAEVEHQNENGHTPLMEAASCGHVGVAKLLLDYGANINTHSNEFKESALTLACYKGHLEMVQFLLNAGADQEHKTDEMHTALMEASMDGHVDVARLLLDHGAQVNMPVDSFESPLTLAACGGHYELVALLISRGADLEEVNDEGYTPLMEAAREGHEEVVTLLVEHGAHVNGQTEETQETALTLACCGGFLDVVQYLIEHGADIELGASTPLMEAAQEGHVEIVKYLIEKGANVHAETSTQDTALTYASANGHTIISDILLQCGANLEHECEGGRTPLMKAARAGHLQTVQFLANKGADINRHTSNNDHTVLSLACSGGHISTVQYLLGQGANPTHILRDNATMLTEASRGGHLTVANLLLQQQRLRGAPPSSSSSSTSHPPTSGGPRGNKEHHYDRLKFSLSGGRKKAGQAAHHHHHHQGHPHPATTGNTTATNKTHKVPSTTQQEAKPQRKTQTSSASDAGGGGPVDSVGSAKRQKISEDSSSKHQQPTPTGEGGASLPPRNIPRYEETDPQPPRNVPRQGVNNSRGPPTSTKPPALPPKVLSSSSHPQQQPAPPPLSSVPSGQQQLSPEDVLVRCMLQMAQQQAAGVGSHPQQSSTASPSLSVAPISTSVTTSSWSENSTTSLPPGDPSVAAPSAQRDLKSSKGLGSPSSVFSRGNFAPLDHLSSSLSSSSSSSSSQPPKFPSRGKTTTTTVATSGTITSSVPTMTSSTTTTLPPSSMPAPGGAFTNADLTRLIPHLEAIAGSLQNSPSLETHCLAALAQTHILPTLAGYDPSSPQAAQVLEALQSIPLVGDGKAPPPLPNSSSAAAVGGDLASFLAGLDMNALMQNLTGQELLGLDQGDVHSQAAYPGEGGAGKRSQRSAGGVGDGEQGGGGSKVESEIHSSRTRPLTTSFLLDHNFPMDIPPPTDLLPDHLPLPSGYVPTVENESYLSSEEDDLEEEGSDTSYLAQDMTLPPGSYDPAIEIDQQTDSNHDTALTLAAAGGHDELVELLISHGANIEHRDKKGCTPLILAASAGHAVVVAILLDHTADIEAQSDRTKDTALSLACSGGRQEVVEILLAKGANFEHRNVSDYTPLSLAASGGYVNIIKMLLRAGADINSRTGSKLGITPLMLAAMNGHTATVKLLLDMGSDINAQIETNRNTALTLACFQGRHEVVSLLVERQANVEHRAKTGLTPLMEAASGGYHEVGRVLINKGADVNAAPVPSSKDTALTIAADKGHYRFVDLILREGAHVDVKNKKGNSPLWLAANGGHLDVVKLLVDHGSDLDSQDNRKVSCLMAAFRKGHFKVVKYLVDHVSQFPSDADLTRYVSTLSDKESLKKCQRCMEVIIDAKERQAAEANKNATILLQEIDQEKKHEEDRKAAAARKRAKKKRQKEKKQALKAQKGDKVGEKGGAGGGGGDSPPEVDPADDATDDVMAENGEIPEELSPVERIPPKEPPLPVSLPLTKKQSPAEREKAGGEREGGSRGSSRVSRLPSTSSITSMSLSLGGVASSGGTTPTSSPRKGKKEDGWKEVGKRTKKVSVPGSVFAAVVGKNNCNLHLIKQATNTHIEVEGTSKTASTRALSVRGSTEAIKQAQHIISQLVKDPSHNIANVLPKQSHQVAAGHGHKSTSAAPDHTVTTTTTALPHSSLLGDHRVPPSSSLSLTSSSSSSSSSSLPLSTTRTTIPKKSSVLTAISTVAVTRSSTVNSLPITTARMGKPLSDKRHSVPQSVLVSSDMKTTVGGVVLTTQTRVAASVVSSAATVKFSVPLTPTSGPVRRLFTTTAVHSGATQTVAVVSVAQTTALPASTLAPGGFVPPPPRVPSVAAVVGPQPLGRPIQPASTTVTNINRTLPSHTDHYEPKTTKTEPVPTTNTYSRAIGSHLTNQISATSSLIEQPLQQIMKTPTIFQEPATQLTKPKKYSDAVGKKTHEAVAHSTAKPTVSGNPLVSAPAPVVSHPLTHPTLSLPPSLPPPLPLSLPSSLTSSLPPSLPHPVPSLNLAPGSRLLMADDKTQAASFSQTQLSDKFTSALWMEDRNIADHRPSFDGDDRLTSAAPSLGPIGPPSKIPKPPMAGGPAKSVSSSVSMVGGRGGGGEIGPPGRGAEGGRFSPIGSRGGARTSPSGGGVVNMSPQQRSSDPSPVAKSPLLGPAPPGGLLPTPDKLYTSSVGFRPIQSQSTSQSADFSLSSSERVPDVLPLTPTPVRNPRPPLLATPPGFPPPFLPQGIHQSPIHPSKQAQKPASPVQPVNASPDKISPNKSPPQVPPASKGFNPNAPTFVPMGLPSVQRPANPPPTSSILGAPPISKLTNFPPPPVGSSILGTAPPIGGGPRMVGPNIHPSQPPQPPPPPPPTGAQTSILGQPPTPPINPHIFNPPALPPGQQNFPPKPPSQPMFGQFEGNQPSQGVLQPPMPPFGIIFPGNPQPQQNFVGQPSQNFTTTKEFLPGPLEGGQFLPNPMSQQTMLNQGGPPPGGSSEISRFGVPLMKVGKPDPESADPVLGVTTGAPNIPLPPMMISTTETGGSFEATPSHPQLVRPGNVFGMGIQPSQPGLRPVPEPAPPTSSGSILGNFTGGNLDLFPTFLPISDRSSVPHSAVPVTTTPHPAGVMMAPPSVFSGAPPTSSAPQELGGGVAAESLLPIGTERAHKGAGLGGVVSGSGSTSVSTDSGSSFPMLAPGINPSSVWSYSGSTGSHEESDWSKQVGGGSVTSDPHNRWPDSVKTSQQSRNSNDVTITSQDTLQSLLARVGLTEHMELFQSNEIDLEALRLMSDKDFSEIGLPQTAQITLMNSLGRRTTSAGREEGVASAPDQGDGRGFPSSSRQQEDSL